jgi:cytochrome P450
MRAYGRLIQETAARHFAEVQPGQPFDLHELAREISLEVIMRAVFGLIEPERVREFGDALTGMLDAARPSFLSLKFLRHEFGGLSAWARFRRACERADQLLLDEIAARRAHPEPREDILSMMLEARYEDGSLMSDVAAKEEAITLLQAGHATTATALAWAFDAIYRDPEIVARLEAELAAAGDEPETVTRLPYLEAVCHESLRLFPLAPGVMRRLAQPLTVQGIELPAGGHVCAGVVMTHHREELYPEPARFRPERFLERKFSPFEYMPFGGGMRRCLGAALALYEMKLVIATLVRSGRLRLTRLDPVKPVMKVAFVGPGRAIEMVRD